MVANNVWRFGAVFTAACAGQIAVADSGFLSLTMSKHNTQRLASRQNDLSIGMAYDNSSYLIDVEIGTPKQQVKIAVDIGTYGTWVIESCESLYFHQDECKKIGTFNESLSETREYNSDDYYGDTYFDLQDGDSHRFSYYSDDFTIAGGETLKNVTFGIYRYPSTLQYGTLGLGFGQGINTNGTSMMDNLVSQGIINTKTFGITLGGDNLLEGSLVLGGVDTKKFSGPLTKVPIADPPVYPFDYEEYRYWLALDGVTLHDGAGNSTATAGFKVMPQTIDPVSYLPQEIVDTVAAAFGVRNTSEDDWYIVHCDWKTYVNGSLDLEFPDFSVNIPYSEFVVQSDIRDGLENECYIGVIARHEDDVGLWYLGHAFLRSVYAVFDQEEKAVWLARYEDCGSDAVAFTQGSEVRGQCEGTSSSSPGGGGSSNPGGTPDDEGVGARVLSGGSLAALAMFWLCLI